MTNVIRDGDTGVVFPVGDIKTAATKIRPLTAPGALTALSDRARAKLPPAYTLARFEQSWHDALAECLAMPLRTGSRSDLPPLVSPGRLARVPWLRRAAESGTPGPSRAERKCLQARAAFFLYPPHPAVLPD